MKTFLGYINNYANLILVIITAIYAFLTYRMVSIMKSQVVAKIKISNIILGSCLLREKESGESDNFLNKIIKTPIDTIIGSIDLHFVLFFEIRNGSSGSGSIDKPQLVLKYMNQYIKSWHDVEYVINPITTEQEYVRSYNTGGSSINEYKNKDLGKTLFLKGGDSEKIKLEYLIHPISIKNKDSFSGLLALFKDNPFRLKYYIRYKDNLGKSYEIEADNIISDIDN